MFGLFRSQRFRLLLVCLAFDQAGFLLLGLDSPAIVRSLAVRQGFTLMCHVCGQYFATALLQFGVKAGNRVECRRSLRRFPAEYSRILAKSPVLSAVGVCRLSANSHDHHRRGMGLIGHRCTSFASPNSVRELHH
jgi:hypothetical protein